MSERELQVTLGIDEALIEKVSWDPLPARKEDQPNHERIEEALQVLAALATRVTQAASGEP